MKDFVNFPLLKNKAQTDCMSQEKAFSNFTSQNRYSILKEANTFVNNSSDGPSYAQITARQGKKRTVILQEGNRGQINRQTDQYAQGYAKGKQSAQAKQWVNENKKSQRSE